jgi:hypothetical protein
MEHADILKQIREIIKIREKYEHLVNVSLPIWEKKNNYPYQTVMIAESEE